MHRTGGKPGAERGDREHRPYAGIAQLEGDLFRRGRRIDEQRSAPVARRKRDDELCRRRKQDRCPPPRKRADQRRASLQQREARSDERRGARTIDAAATGGETE